MVDGTVSRQPWFFHFWPIDLLFLMLRSELGSPTPDRCMGSQNPTLSVEVRRGTTSEVKARAHVVQHSGDGNILQTAMRRDSSVAAGDTGETS